MRSIGFVRSVAGWLGMGLGAGCAGLRKPSAEQLIKEGTTRWVSEDRYVYVGRCGAFPDLSLAEESARLEAWEPAVVRWAQRNPEEARCVSVTTAGDGWTQNSTQNFLMSGVSMNPVEKESCVTHYGNEGEMISILVDVSAAQFFCR